MSNYEVLESLPAYGPMYIPVSEDGDPYYSDNGYVVRFYKRDGSNWVANFKPGWTKCCGVYKLSNQLLLILANGLAYVMNPEQTEPLQTFGVTINQVIETENEFIMSDNIHIITFTKNCEYWRSERISWNGIDNLQLTNNVVTGDAYDSMTDKWSSFELNLSNRILNGGTF